MKVEETILDQVRESIDGLAMPHVQVGEPFFSHVFLRVYPPHLGIDAVELLKDFLEQPSERKRILQELQLGTPRKIMVRPAAHARDKNDLELWYDEDPPETALPPGDFAEGMRQTYDAVRKTSRWELDFTIKTCASGNIPQTLELLIDDMITRKEDLQQAVHGLLIFFLAGYPKNIPNEEITLKTRFFMVLVAIPVKVITMLEQLLHDQNMTRSKATLTLLQLLQARIDDLIKKKKEREDMAVLNVINPERSLLYYTTNRTATMSVALAEMQNDVNTLKSDVNSLKGDMNTLKSDMNTLKGDVAILKEQMQELLDILKRTRT